MTTPWMPHDRVKHYARLLHAQRRKVEALSLRNQPFDPKDASDAFVELELAKAEEWQLYHALNEAKMDYSRQPLAAVAAGWDSVSEEQKCESQSTLPESMIRHWDIWS
jgi:hypothetical protein